MYDVETDSREILRHQIAELPKITESDPATWWRNAAEFVINTEKWIATLEDRELAEYLQLYLHQAKNMLRLAINQQNASTTTIIQTAETIIMDLSMEMASSFEPTENHTSTSHLSLDELMQLAPDRFSLHPKIINGISCQTLKVRHPCRNEWFEIPLPLGEKIWHKGGPARAVLDIAFHSPESMQASEFPWNDFDTVVAGDKNRGIHVAEAIGVDADGIELMGEDNLNFPRFCLGRDTQQNQVCLGADGLHFSDHAVISAQTGHVNIVGEYVANKAIYGIDRMYFDGVGMAKQRGLMRLLKAVAEGKALSFDHIPLNSNLDMGVYILFLAKKWQKKANFDELLHRSYFLLVKMGQIRAGEDNIYLVLERAHQENPFFDFDSEVRLPIEVVRWKTRKLVKQIDREASWKFQFSSTADINRFPGDDIPQTISLDGYIPNKSAASPHRWYEFVAHCRHRTRDFLAIDRSAYDKIFTIGFDESSDLRPEQ